MNGTFIVFEGIDHSGKSTQVRLLSKKLIEKGYEVLNVREPGGTNISEKIRKIILDNKNIEMHEKTEALLFQASRAQLVNEKILPALKEGKVVIADRYIFSSLAYQGGGRLISKDSLKSLCSFATGDLLPDFTFFTDISFETYAQRKNWSRKNLDRIEQENASFFTEVRKAYLNLVNEFENFCVVDSNGVIEKIHLEICKILSTRLKGL
ncbi:MAG: dTMP kinase [Calditrichaeota bacterium]|nr:MAG: dTMP kinase [Calditrichota bacterium]